MAGRLNSILSREGELSWVGRCMVQFGARQRLIIGIRQMRRINIEENSLDIWHEIIMLYIKAGSFRIGTRRGNKFCTKAQKCYLFHYHYILLLIYILGKFSLLSYFDLPMYGKGNIVFVSNFQKWIFAKNNVKNKYLFTI